MQRKNEFPKTATGTLINIEIPSSNVADLEEIIEMGFKEGFTAAYTNSDELPAQ